MIGRLSGTLLEKLPPQVLLDVGGGDAEQACGLGRMWREYPVISPRFPYHTTGCENVQCIGIQHQWQAAQSDLLQHLL